MARYEDLAPLDYFGEVDGARLVAIGWVESPEQCDGREVDAPLFEALVHLLLDPWQPFAMAGFHECTMCKYTGGPHSLKYGSMTVRLGANNLFVFGQDQVYVAPSTIVHYIDAHGYSPPQEFRMAVHATPPMRSVEYLKLVRHHGLHRLAVATRRGSAVP